ncbi:unnamed protein product [Phaeothamnion confervicola]
MLPRFLLLAACVAFAQGFVVTTMRVDNALRRREAVQTAARFAKSSLGRRDAIRTAISSFGFGLVALSFGLSSREAHATMPSLTVNQVKHILEGDFTDKKYLLTGDLTRDIYNPDCRFTDPTTVSLFSYFDIEHAHRI